MDVIKITHQREEFLFNGRAYMSINNSAERLLELEKELESIGEEYLIIFQLEAMYDYHKNRGLPANTVSVVAQLNIGDCCLVKAKVADAKIRRLSKSFCSIEWIQ